jgi:hypothetical protein
MDENIQFIVTVTFNSTKEKGAELTIFFSRTDIGKINFATISHNRTTAGAILDWGELSHYACWYALKESPNKIIVKEVKPATSLSHISASKGNSPLTYALHHQTQQH